MRPKIKLRTLTTTDNALLNALLQSTLAEIKTAKQMGLVITLLHRYGVSKPDDLLPKQVSPFTTELKAVLAGQAPDPSDSILDPTTMEIR